MSLCLVTESCLLACTTGTWCVDTGATNHVCNSLQGFHKTRRLARGEIDILMGDTLRVAAVAVGVVTLHFEGGKFLVLDDCLYVPKVRRNLVSVFCLSCNGYSSVFNKNSIFVKYNDDIICREMLQDNLYLLEPISLQINSHETNHKRKEISPVNQAHLWHHRLGHINLERIRMMVTGGLISPLDVTALEGKITMRPFKAKGYRAKRYWIWYTPIFVGLCPLVQDEGMSISSHLLMITQGTDTST